MRRITYGPGSTNIGEPQIPNIHNVPFSVLAEVVVEGGAKQEGVVAALGGIAAGWSLYVKNGTPIFAYNFFGIDRYRIRSSEELPAGISRLRVDVIPLQPGEGKPAKVVMSINGRKTGDGVVERTVPFRFGVEPFDIGMDNVSPVSDDYFSPFKFTGQIRAVIIELQPPGVELQGTISRAIR
jgi:arylsulfatase